MNATQSMAIDSRPVRSVVLAGLSVIVISGLLAMGAAEYIEVRRVDDAKRAFDGLDSYGITVLSQPLAFHRHCHYVVEVGPLSDIADENISVLLQLNALPTANTLDVAIASPDITDASLAVLSALTSADVLDVTGTGLTHEGVLTLRKDMPWCSITQR